MRLLLLGFLVAASALAQAPDPWVVVESLPSGQDGAILRLRLVDGKARGPLISADADGLVLRTGSGAERRIDRDQIRTVKLRSKGNAPVWGTLAGLGFAVPTATISDSSGSGGGRAGTAVGLVGGGFLIGTLIKNGKTRTIYQAP